MNNLYRELAPISAAAWASIEQEAKRSFTLQLAGRRVAEVREPGDGVLSAVGTGHLADLDSPAPGVLAWARTAQPVIELRVPFALSRRDIDDAGRGARDPDWQPLKDAARNMAFAEDRAIFEGYRAAGIAGLRAASPSPALELPADARQYPDVITRALASLRLAGVDGPYALVLSTRAFDAVAETSDYGYPIRDHLARLADGPQIWAPAIDGAFLASTRGGDYELHLGQDLSIGYESHDSESVRLYFTEAFTFCVHTPEAIVPIAAARP